MYFDEKGVRREKSARTTDKRVAQRIANEIEAQVALRREGVIDSRMDSFSRSERLPLSEHVEVYLSELEAAERSPRTLETKKRVLEWLQEDGEIRCLRDLTAERVGAKLAAFRRAGRAARTVNQRFEVLRAFANWCVKTERMERNPLLHLPKLNQAADRRYKRRALEPEELDRLFAVAEEQGRKAWYMAALWAGLRRSELGKITWGDVDFQAQTIEVAKGKAKRVDVIPLHPELAAELLRIRPDSPAPTDRIFPTAVMNRTRQRDFERAEIGGPDSQGRVADLHSLRATLGTMLARDGVAPQVAKQIMRHADYSTTLQHYTTLTLKDSASAVARLSRRPVENEANAGSDDTGEHQQKHQQLEHDEAQRDASACDEETDAAALSLRRKRPSDNALRRTKPQRRARKMARPAGFEPATPGLGNQCSILLSYGRMPGQGSAWVRE